MLESMSPRRSLLHEARCQTCSLSSLCLPLALELDDMGQFDAIIRRRAPLKRRATVSPGRCLYQCLRGTFRQPETSHIRRERQRATDQFLST